MRKNLDNIKETDVSGTVLLKTEIDKELGHSINQKEYLRVFLTDGKVPIDNSASAVIYSITETAHVKNLNVYYYTKHPLTKLPQLMDENGNIEQGAGATRTVVENLIGGLPQ